jgi:glutathione S-transferase
VDPYPSGLSDAVVVYGRPTVRVQKVYNTLAELGLRYETVEFPKAPEWYTSINPRRLIPSIRDGPLVLCESNTICAYLAQEHSDKGLWPNSAGEVATAWQWLEFVENYLCSARFNPVFHARVRNAYPPSLGIPGCPPEEEVEKSIDQTAAAMKILDSHLGANTYIGGDSFTFVDAACSPWVHRWAETVDKWGPKLAPSEFPAVTEYYLRVASRPAFAASVGSPAEI